MVQQRIDKILIKVEINNLINQSGNLDIKKIDRLAMICSNLQNSGIKVMMVSSGAIFLGSKKLNLPEIPDVLTDKQAIAAIGQVELIKMYQTYFGAYNQIVAQVLLTKDVVRFDERVINARNTFKKLLDMNIIPVINENDTVSVEDIRLEDNYPLAINVANIVNVNYILVKGNNSHFIMVYRNGKKTRIEDHKIIDQLESMNINEGDDLGKFPDNYNI